MDSGRSRGAFQGKACNETVPKPFLGATIITEDSESINGHRNGTVDIRTSATRYFSCFLLGRIPFSDWGMRVVFLEEETMDSQLWTSWLI